MTQFSAEFSSNFHVPHHSHYLAIIRIRVYEFLIDFSPLLLIKLAVYLKFNLQEKQKRYSLWHSTLVSADSRCDFLLSIPRWRGFSSNETRVKSMLTHARVRSDKMLVSTFPHQKRFKGLAARTPDMADSRKFFLVRECSRTTFQTHKRTFLVCFCPLQHHYFMQQHLTQLSEKKKGGKRSESHILK